MRITALEGAAGNNPALREALTEIEQYLTLMANQLGIDPRASQQVVGRSRVSPPSQATFTASGVNGMFVVEIENSVDPTNQQDLTIYHQVRTATDTPIEHPNQFDDTPINPATHVVIPDPNATKFIGIRSKFINSKFNNWRVLPAAVYSGSITAASLPSSDVSKQFNTGGYPLLSQADGSGMISMPATIIQFPGSDPVSYAASSLSGLTLGLTYYVYVDDPARAGGPLQIEAATDPFLLTANEGRIFLGVIKLKDGGGALLFPYGTRGGCVVGTVVTMSDGSLKNVENLVVGDLVKGIDSMHNETVAATNARFQVPSFAITSSTGKTVGVSGDVSLQLGPGSRFPVVDMVPNDTIDTKDGQEQIATKVYVGLQNVIQIDLSYNRFLLGNGIWVG